ncbi:MAG: filamentous hemagglutinin N-terminal domain-containing protein [Nitrospirae bacterium]|nr:filamentous hemagglutinin N-terminal domain-containing protein [Nitrospirota bacterium]
MGLLLMLLRLSCVAQGFPSFRTVTLAFLILFVSSLARAQVAPITPSGMHTQVSDPIAVGALTQYDITGGTRPGGGVNLFHSFGDFNVPTNNIANFLNTGSVDLNGTLLPQNLPTDNIFGRVTEQQNPSIIFGMIQTNGPGGFDHANLFLMNPHGFLFGPNATVNVGGMVAFTTTDYLRLTDGARFNAVPDIIADALLTASPVAAFGFLGTNPQAIRVEGSRLTLATGTGISLLGGNITVGMDMDSVPGTPASISAPGGQINLVSTASPGEVLLETFAPSPNINGQTFTTLGTVILNQESSIDVSGDGAGTIHIRGGQFILDGSSLVARTTGDTAGASTAFELVADNAILSNGAQIVTASIEAGAAGAIQLSVRDTVQISGVDSTLRPSSISSTSGSGGHGGDILVESSRVTLIEGGQISSLGFAEGVGGNVTVNADTVLVAGISVGGAPSSIQTQTLSAAGGTVSVNASSVMVDTLGLIQTLTNDSGSAGDLTVTATDMVAITGGGAIQTISGSSGASGSVSVSAGNTVSISGAFEDGSLSRIENNSAGDGAVGSVFVGARNIAVTDGGRIRALSAVQNGPMMVISAPQGTVLVSRGGAISNTIDGVLEPGTLSVTAGAINVTDFGIIRTSTVGDGNAGSLSITADRITLSTGGQLNSSSDGGGVGRGGDIDMTITDTLSISGARINEFGSTVPSGIVSKTISIGDAGIVSVTAPHIEVAGGGIISTSTESTGAAGSITLKVNDLNLKSGSQLTSTSAIGEVGRELGLEATGNAGTVTIQGQESSAQSVLIDGAGTGVFTDTQGTGAGGNIFVNANTVTLQNGGTLSAKTSGTEVTATGGTITVDVANTVSMSSGASVSASSTGPGNTGNIQIDAGNQFAMTNSSVTTEANQASGGAIKITTDPGGTVQLMNSTISASVLDGTGGGGSVDIDPQYVILLNSQILANAFQGPGGNISITTNFILPDANSVISASSQFGVNGTITIQSPNAPVSGQIQPLGKTPLIATSLMNQHCAAVAGGQFSSFTVAGRDSLPTEPGSWLASPLAMLGTGTGESLSGLSSLSGEVRGGLAAHQIDQIDKTDQTDQPLLSLRQIAPAGFLTQAFAVERSAGCRS